MVRKFEFSVSTRYVGSEVEETIEIEIPDDATENEIEEIVQQRYDDWLWNNIDTNWEETK